MTATPASERLLEDLNPSQRDAVTTTSGPLAIIAGAGSGKTRVISRRAAYAIETDAAPADQILLVTFTDKAANEMVERMAALGHPGVMARTFHAAALAQLRHFWPSRHDGAPLPSILDSKLRLLVPLVGLAQTPSVPAPSAAPAGRPVSLPPAARRSTPATLWSPCPTTCWRRRARA